MGFLDAGVRTGRARQKKSLIAEAQQAGASVVQIVEVGDDDAAARATLGTMFSLFAGGRVGSDGVQIVRMELGGWPHLYVQPYSGMYPVPGEHHAVLTGSVPCAAILKSGGAFSRPKWESPAMPTWAEALHQYAPVWAEADRLVWDWKSGLTKIDLPWTVQLRPLGDGTTHVAMLAGRYGGVLSYEVGIAQFTKLCGVLHACLQAIAVPEQHFLAATQFAPVATAMLRGEIAAPHAPVDVELDYGHAVRSALAPHLGKGVWCGQVPAKQENNVRRHVLPPEYARVPLLAAIDLTLFGSAKDAIAVTPRHLFVRSGDDQLALELRDVAAADREPGALGAVEIETRRFGRMEIPVGSESPAVFALMQAIAAHNQGGTGRAEVSAFVSRMPASGISMEEAQALQREWQAVMQTNDVSAAINAAARLMTTGQFEACIAAYGHIAQRHPELFATCQSQIGAAYYFLGQYEQAIAYYEYAKQHGADPRDMDDNIREARQSLGR